MPMTAFRILVKNIEEAKLLLKTLANYDEFQFRYNIKPDYTNAGGLEIYVGNVEYETSDGWVEYHDDEDRDIDEIMKKK